jgi:tetratricopeptide (TPR) repeat protein
MNPNLLDAVYGLGMALKSQNRADEAIQAFNQAIALLDDGAYEDKARAAILRRIIRAQRIFVGAAPEQAST